MRQLFTYVHLALIAAMLGTPALAQEEASKPALMVELNTAQTTQGGCRLSFLIQNEHAAEISVVFETVLFTAEGGVNQLTLFDFGALPSNRPRVRQFDVPGVTCEGLGSILINGATSCEAGDLGPAICTDSLMLKTRTSIEMLG